MRNKNILESKLHDIEGMPVDLNFKDVIRYTVFNSSKDKLKLIDKTEDGLMLFNDENGRARVRIEIESLSDEDYNFFEKAGLEHVIGTVKKAYVI